MDNHKDRVTQFFVIPNDVFGEDQNSLYEFVGRYLNAMSLRGDILDYWAKNGASMKEYPIHKGEEKSLWDTIEIAKGKELSLFPFTKKAITNLYMCILQPDYRTPRYEVVDYTKDDQSYIIYRKIWKSKPQMTHYEKDYYEAEYIENCEIKKITRCNKLFEFEEIYSHKRLLEICSSNEFMMATWKLIDEKYIGDFDCHLYVITDATEIPIGLLYYHLFNDKFHISGFEVASTMRRLGIGTAIIKQFFNEYKVSSNDIFLEPLNKESEKFWKKLGIKCSLY